MLTLNILVPTPTQPVIKVDWPSTLHQLIFSGPNEGFVQFCQASSKKPAPEKSDSLICSYRAIRTWWLFNHLVQYGLTFPSTMFSSDHVYFANQTAGRIRQFNQGTHWGTPDLELSWCIYATHMFLFCDIKSNFPPHDSMYNVELASNTQVLKHLSAKACEHACMLLSPWWRESISTESQSSSRETGRCATLITQTAIFLTGTS